MINGISGSEIFCLVQKKYQAGDLIIGNSVYSAGFIKGLTGVMRKSVGREFNEATRVLSEGRKLAHERLINLAFAKEGCGIIKANNEIIHYAGCMEFCASGSITHTEENKQNFFITTANGQELYALLDAGYFPINLAYGNIVYAMGTSSGLFRSLKNLSMGEIPEFSEMLNATRHAALERVISDAKKYNADALLSIKTIFSPVGKACEMLLMGTACKRHLNNLPRHKDFITSNLTNIEMWNLAKVGYTPTRFLLSSTVFSLGISTNINSALKSMVGKENTQLKVIISDCRDKAIHQLNEQAKALGADKVVGSKIYLYQLGNGLVEFLAMGTAVKKDALVKTESDQLPLQVVLTEEYKFYDNTSANFKIKENTPIGPLMRVVMISIILIVVLWYALSRR